MNKLSEAEFLATSPYKAYVSNESDARTAAALRHVPRRQLESSRQLHFVVEEGSATPRGFREVIV